MFSEFGSFLEGEEVVRMKVIMETSGTIANLENSLR